MSTTNLARTTVLAAAVGFAALLGGMAIAVGTVKADGMPGETEPAACRAETAGALQCMGGVLCECVHTRGGTITGDLAGYRWQCGAKRPRCGSGIGGPDAPATLNPYYGPYPNSVSMDRENVIIRQDTDANANANSGDGDIVDIE